MSEKTHRVRMVVTDQPAPGQAIQLETKPMTRSEATRIAAEAVGRGIPAAVHPA